MFSGVGKTEAELAAAVDAGILCVNVESEPELMRLSAIASAKGRRTDISLRVNPDVDARTHAKIATGKSENKFGIPISRAREVYAHAAKLPGLRVSGVDMHIGSQITELQPFDDAFALLSEFVHMLRADGHAIEHVDLGGGLGIPYRDGEDPPGPEAYAAVVKRATASLDCPLIFEPGRLIVGNAGILVTRVLYVKRGEAKTFVIVDAGMNDLVRPTLYEAHHEVRLVKEPPPGARQILADVVGPVCEIGRLSRARPNHARAGAGRPSRRHDGGRLWGRAGRNLQHAAAGCGSDGKGQPVERGAAPYRRRRDHRARSVARLDVIDSVSISLAIAAGPQDLHLPSTGRENAAQASSEICFRALLCM